MARKRARSLIQLVAACTIVAAPIGAKGQNRVLTSETIGPWSVRCVEEGATGSKSCLALNNNIGRREFNNAIIVVFPASSSSIAVRILARPGISEKPFLIRFDSGQPEQMKCARLQPGDCRLSPESSQSVLAMLEQSTTVHLRIYPIVYSNEFNDYEFSVGQVKQMEAALEAATQKHIDANFRLP
jgi:hypothetical protein